MISFNSSINSKQSNTGILINQHVTVQAAADVTGYNIQYLRRLLRSGTLEGIKIGQIWLIEMQSLETYLQLVENTTDRRCGPR
jgi:excisionase family DNA binding protein